MKFLFFLFVGFICMADLSLAQEAKVEVEQVYIETEDALGTKSYKKTRYQDLRSRWGIRFGVIASKVDPLVEHLKAEKPHNVRVDLSFNRNFSFFSVGLALGATQYDWSNANDILLKTKAYNLGLVARLDTFFSVPYVVPLLEVGVSHLESSIFPNGVEEEIPVEGGLGGMPLYYRYGLLFSLNWIERGVSENAFRDYGLLNTYVYVGLRKLMETNPNPLLNIETNAGLEFGLQLEF